MLRNRVSHHPGHLLLVLQYRGGCKSALAKSSCMIWCYSSKVIQMRLSSPNLKSQPQPKNTHIITKSRVLTSNEHIELFEKKREDVLRKEEEKASRLKARILKKIESGRKSVKTRGGHPRNPSGHFATKKDTLLGIGLSLPSNSCRTRGGLKTWGAKRIQFKQMVSQFSDIPSDEMPEQPIKIVPPEDERPSPLIVKLPWNMSKCITPPPPPPPPPPTIILLFTFRIRR